MRSLPEIANERIGSFVSAISDVREQVMVKGFLGPSIRENNSLPSVGIRAARRAGITVDENGRMRCPPGTANANQFTDMQMSNCMVPSAETLANAASTLVDNTVDSLNGSQELVESPVKQDTIEEAEIASEFSVLQAAVIPDILTSTGLKAEDSYDTDMTGTAEPEVLNIEQYQNINDEKKRLRTAQ
jgi:hypothetical protein